MNNQITLDNNLQEKSKKIFEKVNINQPGAASIGQLRTIMDARVNKQQSQGLNLPANYSASNALTSAFLKLQNIQNAGKKYALEVCTPTSIIQSLMDMVVQGLSPAKNQCYFIVYGNELQMQRSYFGTVAALKRLENISDVNAQVIYDGDKVSTKIDNHGNLVLDTSNTHLDWANQDNEIKGAYAIVTTSDGVDHLTIMTIKQIKVSWSQSKTHKVQDKFGSEMAQRTVLNRAAKMYVNTSDDSDLLTGAINDTTSNEYDDERRDVTPADNGQQTTAELLAGFRKSQEAKAKGVSNNGNSNEGGEASEEVADGQTELFSEGTIKPADEADS